MTDFYMVLPSNSCSNTQPENHASNFTVEWDTPYNLTGRWQVALTEFKCNFPLYTLPKGGKISIEKVYAPIGTITKDKIECTDPKYNKSFKLFTDKKKITIKYDGPSSFCIRFLSLADAKKVGFEYDEVIGFEKIRANNIHTLGENEKITIRLVQFTQYFHLTKFKTTHVIYADKIIPFDYLGKKERVLPDIEVDLKDSIDFEKTDDIITLSIRHKYTKRFSLRFKNEKDARKAGFTSYYHMVRGHITAISKHTIKPGKFVEVQILNSHMLIERHYKEYILTDIDRYFPSSSLLVNYLNSLILPIKFKLVDKRIEIITSDDEIHRIDFSFPLQYILGFQKKYIPNERYFADFIPQLDKAYGDVYIYSDIVNTSYVGGTLTPLLKSLNINKSLKFGQELVYEIPFPLYTDVAKSSVNQIIVNIRNHNGNYIPFAESAVTTLTLHFKQL